MAAMRAGASALALLLLATFFLLHDNANSRAADALQQQLATVLAELHQLQTDLAASSRGAASSAVGGGASAPCAEGQLPAEVARLRLELAATAARADSERQGAEEAAADLAALREATQQSTAAATPVEADPDSPPHPDGGSARHSGIVHSLLLKLQLENVYAATAGEPPSLCLDIGAHVG